MSKIVDFLAGGTRRFFVLSELGFYSKMPDEEYIKRIYKLRLGEEPDLVNPKTFNEKIQWLKLHDRKPLYTAMVDKYEAKKYVAGIIGESHIIPTIGIWDAFDDVDFSSLPERFVLKCTHDSGGLVICRDRSKLDMESTRKKIENCLKNNYYWHNREWPYKDVKPRIIAEEFFEDKSGNGLTDYKFFCFNGAPEFLYVSKGMDNHSTAMMSFYNMAGEEMPFRRSDYKPFHGAIMPDNLVQMKETATVLAKSVECPFVRIDLYSVGESILFSEITFSPCGGMLPFEPASADLELGKMIHIPALEDWDVK